MLVLEPLTVNCPKVLSYERYKKKLIDAKSEISLFPQISFNPHPHKMNISLLDNGISIEYG